MGTLKYCSLFVLQGLLCLNQLYAWELVFRAASGRLGGANNIVQLWVSSKAVNTNDSKAKTIGSGSSLHYKSEMVDKWDDYIISKVKLAVYVKGTERAYFIFNGTGTDKMSWLSQSRLLASSYIDVKTAISNYFSIQGHMQRQFFLNHEYGGCNGDYGWFVITTGQGCPWDNFYPLPNIMYSPAANHSYVNWFYGGQPADEISISLEAKKRCDGGCLNGGVCLPTDLCLCKPGWNGKHCENAMCGGNCSNHGDCIGPNICKCHGQYNGLRCESNSDPCVHGKIHEVNHPHRSIQYTGPTNNDDSQLIEGWYRFISPAGEQMPMSCKKNFVNMCSTHNPIWLQGKLPKAGDGIANMQGCISNGQLCCNSSIPVRVKQCSNFILYYLQATTKDSGYCVGKETVCPVGQSSKTGYTPGCTKKVPVLSKTPVLSMVHDPKHNDLYFKCNISVPENDKLALLVDWYADGERIKHQQLDFTPYTATLDWREIKGHVGQMITCRVRGKLTGNPILTPELVSNGHFVGIQVKNPPGVPEGSKGHFAELKLTTPFVCEDTKPVNPWEFDYEFSNNGKKCECKIVLKLGVPKYQDHAPPRCATGKEIEQVVLPQSGSKPCRIEILADKWNETIKIPVAAKLDMKYDGDRTRQVEFLPISSCRENIYSKYKPPPFKVTAMDTDSSATCASVNDPHFTTFDGFHYNHYYEGEFVLYRHKRLPYEVRVFYVRCNGHAACNCALAVRSGDDVIVVDYCSKKKTVNVWGTLKTITNVPLRIKGFINGQLTPGTKVISQNDGRQLQIQLPTGTIIRITVEKYGFGTFLNAFIQASAADSGNTEGLCGTFNGVNTDELTLPNGQTYTGIGNAAGQQPHGFSKAWRVDDKDSFYNGLPNGYNANQNIQQTAPSNQICECKLDPFGTNRTIQSSCDHEKDIENCNGGKIGSVSTKDITSQILGQAHHRRRRRSLSSRMTFQDNEVAVFTYDKTFVQKDLSFPTASGMTLATAEQTCRNLFNIKPYANQCDSIVTAINQRNGKTLSLLNTTVDMCVQDILLSDSLVWSKSTLQAFQEICLSELHRDIKSWEYRKGTIMKLPPQFAESMCLNDCSSNGKCVDSVCQCNQGFMGADCSVHSSRAPDVIYLPNGGLCDTSKYRCDDVIVYGDNFVDSSALTCHLQETTIDESGYNMTSTVNKVKGVFRHFGEVGCNLVTSKRKRRSVNTHNVGVTKGFLLSISNNGVTNGSNLMVIMFDSRCQNCSARGTCSFIPDTCYISGQCFLSGDQNPVSRCQFCNPAVSTNNWSEKEGCDNQSLLLTLVIALSVCLVAVIAVVAIMIALKHNKRPTKIDEKEMDAYIAYPVKRPVEAW